MFSRTFIHTHTHTYIGTCILSNGGGQTVNANSVNFTITTMMSTPLSLSCELTDESGMSTSYVTTISSDLVRVDTVVPVITSAFFLNVSDPHPINSEIYLGILFDAYESGIIGTCKLEILTNSIVDETLNLVIFESQDNDNQIFAENNQEVSYFLRHVVRTNDTSIDENQDVYLNCTWYIFVFSSYIYSTHLFCFCFQL